MQDTKYIQNLEILQRNINNLMLLSDTEQREVLKSCLMTAMNQVKAGKSISFEKPVKHFKESVVRSL